MRINFDNEINFFDENSKSSENELYTILTTHVEPLELPLKVNKEVSQEKKVREIENTIKTYNITWHRLKEPSSKTQIHFSLLEEPRIASPSRDLIFSLNKIRSIQYFLKAGFSYGIIMENYVKKYPLVDQKWFYQIINTCKYNQIKIDRHLNVKHVLLKKNRTIPVAVVLKIHEFSKDYSPVKLYRKICE